ncbi:MAG: hypothetical protein ABSG91_19205 [Syntrophobacteraceae bacterium]|jgi:hypothetical protein
MKKLLVGSAIIFLMSFTAGLATAAPPVKNCTTANPCKGNLWFVNDAGTVTEETNASITINGVAKGTLPNDVARTLFFGTLSFTDPVAGATVVNFSAVSGLGGFFSLNGISVSGPATPVIVNAEFKFLGNKLFISGAELGGTALSFEGSFSK